MIWWLHGDSCHQRCLAVSQRQQNKLQCVTIRYRLSFVTLVFEAPFKVHKPSDTEDQDCTPCMVYLYFREGVWLSKNKWNNISYPVNKENAAARPSQIKWEWRQFCGNNSRRLERERLYTSWEVDLSRLTWCLCLSLATMPGASSCSRQWRQCSGRGASYNLRGAE